jgi:hypothetical protein
MRKHATLLIVIAVASLLIVSPTTSAETHPSVCQQDSAYRQLDFWIGHWDVFNTADRSKAGTSVIEKVLGGCALTVQWQEADGSGEVRELFYYQKAKKLWHQVWISDAGPTKERVLVDVRTGGTLVFQGEVPQLDGGSHLDRSTVMALFDGRIHQIIEISRDSGKTWQSVFDADYRKQK